VFSEFSPKNARAKTSTFLSLFWPIGAGVEVALAIIVMAIPARIHLSSSVHFWNIVLLAAGECQIPFGDWG